MTFRQRKPMLDRVIKLENLSLKTGLRATMYMPNGNRYRGEWNEGKKSGLGVMTFRNGTLYEGSWLHGRKHGWGKISENSICGRRLSYTGTVYNGKINGYGTVHAQDGSYYEGLFQDAKRCGHGKCWYSDNSFYIGDWRDNVPDGNGMRVLANGNRYNGQWKNGEREGYGSFYFIDRGQVLRGIWSNGIPISSTIEDLPPGATTELFPSRLPIPVLELDPAAPCLYEVENFRQGTDAVRENVRH